MSNIGVRKELMLSIYLVLIITKLGSKQCLHCPRLKGRVREKP